MSEVKAIPILTLLVVADWLVAGFAGVAGALARRWCFTIKIINMCLLIEKRPNVLIEVNWLNPDRLGS